MCIPLDNSQDIPYRTLGCCDTWIIPLHPVDTPTPPYNLTHLRWSWLGWLVWYYILPLTPHLPSTIRLPYPIRSCVIHSVVCYTYGLSIRYYTSTTVDITPTCCGPTVIPIGYPRGYLCDTWMLTHSNITSVGCYSVVTLQGCTTYYVCCSYHKLLP